MKNKFEEFRLKLGYRKQKDFAELLEINTAQYSKYANHREQPSVDVLYRAAKKLNCSMEDLITEDDIIDKPKSE